MIEPLCGGWPLVALMVAPGQDDGLQCIDNERTFRAQGGGAALPGLDPRPVEEGGYRNVDGTRRFRAEHGN